FTDGEGTYNIGYSNRNRKRVELDRGRFTEIVGDDGLVEPGQHYQDGARSESVPVNTESWINISEKNKPVEYEALKYS
ncbi:34676_t:CDS:2, partial [Racocetra persica]